MRVLPDGFGDDERRVGRNLAEDGHAFALAGDEAVAGAGLFVMGADELVAGVGDRAAERLLPFPAVPASTSGWPRAAGRRWRPGRLPFRSRQCLCRPYCYVPLSGKKVDGSLSVAIAGVTAVGNNDKP